MKTPATRPDPPVCGRLRTALPTLAAALLLPAAAPPPCAADPAPEVRVENVRRAFHNGEHNAFTDLIRWRGKLWLTFRSCPDGHNVHPTSSIIVLSSEDGVDWAERHRFSVPDRDVRDPHFLEFRDRLFIYTGTWWTGETSLPRDEYDLNKHLGYAVHSADGEDWSDPVALEGTYGHYIWRAAVHGDRAYLCGRRKREHSERGSGRGGSPVVESAMLESEDGLVWRFHSLFQTEYGNETAFLFEEDGALVAVSRLSAEASQLARGAPPWRDLEKTELPLFIGGPLLTKWRGRHLVGGRRATPEGPRTCLYWLAGDELVLFATLPSDGDNSYPGFVELEEGRGLVSWYSTHERGEDGEPITAIYTAELVAE